MITTEQRIVLKRLLRGNYIADVLEVLGRQGIVDKNGKSYSTKMISHILNGRYHNKMIEDAIFEVYAKRKILYEQDQEKKNRMLGLDSSRTEGDGDDL